MIWLKISHFGVDRCELSTITNYSVNSLNYQSINPVDYKIFLQKCTACVKIIISISEILRYLYKLIQHRHTMYNIV